MRDGVGFVGVWAWVMPVLALVALLVLCWRISRIRDGRVAGLLFGLLFVLVTLLANTAPLYVALDGLLGGRNVAYLLVQVAWSVSMVAFTFGFAYPVPVAVKRGLWVLLGAVVVLGVVGVVLAPAVWGSVPRLAGYRDSVPALLLTMPANVLSAVVAVVVIRGLVASLRSAEARPVSRVVGVLLVAAGFSAGLVSVIIRVAAAFSGASEGVQSLDGALVLATIFLILAGSAVLAVKKTPVVEVQR